MKRVHRIVECVATVAVLTCCSIAGYLNKQQQDSGEFSEIRVPAVREDDREQSAVQISTERENDKATEIKELGDIKSTVVFEDGTRVVLDEDGRVWQWQEGETKKDLG